MLKWWGLTMSTPGVSPDVEAVIIIMQRLAENDLAGHVLAEGGFVHVCLPLRYERSRMAPSPVRDSDGRPWQDRRSEEGELLAPDQFPEKAVENMERRLGSYGVAGQLQQRPAPRRGALFKRSWFENRRRYELQKGETILRQGRPLPLPLSNCSIFVHRRWRIGYKQVHVEIRPSLSVFALRIRTTHLFASAIWVMLGTLPAWKLKKSCRCWTTSAALGIPIGRR